MSTAESSSESTPACTDDVPETGNEAPEPGAPSTLDPASDPAISTRSWRPGYRTIAATAVVIAVGAAFGIYTLVSSEDELPPAEQAVPTVPVTYEVSGTGVAEISYQGSGSESDAEVVEDVTLPWSVTVDVPIDEDPIVQIILGAEGGEASCSLTVGDRLIQHAIATGEYGRSTCHTTLNLQDATTDPN